MILARIRSNRRTIKSHTIKCHVSKLRLRIRNLDTFEFIYLDLHNALDFALKFPMFYPHMGQEFIKSQPQHEGDNESPPQIPLLLI